MDSVSLGRVVTIVALGMVSLILVRRIFMLIVIVGNSMQPSLVPGDRVIALRIFPRRALRRGRIVLAHLPREAPTRDRRERYSANLYIKRVVGMPGDRLLVGSDASDRHGRSKLLLRSRQAGEVWVIVPNDCCYLRGDSPGLDSDVVGFVPLRKVRGVVVIEIRARKDASAMRVTTRRPLKRQFHDGINLRKERRLKGDISKPYDGCDMPMSATE
jgi:signal peptidase I